MADRAGQPAEPCVMAIFGASGDLTKRKLIPALYNLKKDNLLPEEFAMVGVARSPLSDEEFRNKIAADLERYSPGAVEPEIWGWLAERLHYLPGDAGEPETYQKLSARLEEISAQRQARGNYCFYLATAPRFFKPIVEQLGEAGLTREADGGPWRRVVFEKPFGHDLDSAQALNRHIAQYPRRAADLPHRSLPRQGDGAEHPGLPLSPTASSSRCGTTATSTTCKSRLPRASAWRTAADTTTTQAPCATWCPTTSSS